MFQYTGPLARQIGGKTCLYRMKHFYRLRCRFLRSSTVNLLFPSLALSLFLSCVLMHLSGALNAPLSDVRDWLVLRPQASCSRSAAVNALKKNDGDIVNAIMELTMD